MAPFTSSLILIVTFPFLFCLFTPSSSQVLYAKSNDQRAESFERASLVASSFARHTRGLLLHMSMAHAGLTVQASAGGGDAK